MDSTEYGRITDNLKSMCDLSTEEDMMDILPDIPQDLKSKMREIRKSTYALF